MMLFPAFKPSGEPQRVNNANIFNVSRLAEQPRGCEEEFATAAAYEPPRLYVNYSIEYLGLCNRAVETTLCEPGLNREYIQGIIIIVLLFELELKGIDSVRPQLLTLNTSSLGFLISNLSRVVREVSSEMHLAQTLEDFRGKLHTVRGDVGTLQNSFGGIQTRVNTLQSNITRIGSEIMTPEQKSLIQNLTNAVNLIKNRGDGSGVSTTRFHNLRQRVTSLESQFSDFALVEERVATLEMAISNGTGTPSGNFDLILRKVLRLKTQVNNMRRNWNRFTNRLYLDNCLSDPCYNAATCIDVTTPRGYVCLCPSGFEGNNCNDDVNECINFVGTDLGCQNGATCLNTIGGYSCICAPGWFGPHCTQKSDSCTSNNICGHGTCISTPKNGHPYTCLCDQGWQSGPGSPTCTQDVDECAGQKSPCSHDPPVQCINNYGSFTCGHCPQGFEGNGFMCRDIDECQMNNGGCSMYPRVECINTRPGRRCGPCPSGYSGDGMTCTQVQSPCLMNPCHPMATCRDNPHMSSSYFTCTCPYGYQGNGIGPSGCMPTSQGGTSGGGGSFAGNPCASNPCVHGYCTPHMGSFSCVCNQGYTGLTCAQLLDRCASSPCLNGGTCTSTLTTYTCVCPSSHTGTRCQDENRRCGGILRGTGGVVTYPGEGMDSYHHNVSCAWMILVNHTSVINVTFTDFHLEGSYHHCVFDWLQIHDGPRSSSHLIGRFCGSSSPGVNGTIISSHNALYLWFRSDHSEAGSGFSFTWNITEPVCGGAITNQAHGSINSPGYPGRYPHNRDCYWTIQAEPGKRIQFAFATLQIENHPNCSFDYLAIRDGVTEDGPLLNKFCSSQTPPPLITSNSEAMIHFHSDDSMSDTGFHITFVTIPGIPGCGGLLTNDESEFSPPTLSSEYHNNLNCEWVIRVSLGEKIELNFTSFDIEYHRHCRWDFLEIRDGGERDSPLIGRFCGYDLPGPFMSSSNQLFVRFVSDFVVTHTGFKAKYRVGCGGEFSEETGVLQSPKYPSYYPHDRVCIYAIRQPFGKAIVLNFTDFELEGGQTCPFDYLKVIDGLNPTSPLLGTYCGPAHRAPDLITSSLNGLMLKFVTDGSVTNRGFSAYYSTIDIACGGIMHSLSGTFSSPNSPNQYPNNIDCQWVIQVPPEYTVQVVWHTFSLEHHFSCNYDYIEVFDNSTIPGVSGRIGSRYCGNTVPPIMTSLENIMTIHFHSDSAARHDGFSASYHALHTARTCGGHYHTSSGMIQSPNYPQGYPHSRTCSWTITVAANHQIRLNFTDFDVEGAEPNCPYDFLEIRNGGLDSSPLLQKICGQNKTVSSIFSHAHQLFLKFKSDDSFSRRGFRVFWEETATGCGGTVTSPTGEIASPGYPQSFNRLAECYWTIKVNKGSRIRFHFVDLDFHEASNECYHDYVELRDGPRMTSPLKGRYCSLQGLLSFNSTGNEIKVKFRGGWTAGGRGFRARYHSICNTELHGLAGVIESPNFPNMYPHDRDCTWVIKAPRGNSINASFSHFEVEDPASATSAVCEYDFVEIRVGHQTGPNTERTTKGHFCGSSIPNQVSSGPRMDIMEVQFKSDEYVATNGFRLEWVVSGCSEVLRGFRGIFQSPNYPNAYPTNTQCQWHIIGLEARRIKIRVEEFDIESSFHPSECTFDSLKIYGGETKEAPVLLTLCHHEEGFKEVTTQGSNALVYFESDGSVRGKGFRISYENIPGGCGGDFKSTKGEIHSPGYPTSYHNDADCVWHLEVNENHVVELEFKDFDIEHHDNCSYDYVKVYDGANTEAPVLMGHCGENLPSPPTIRSTGRYMTVHLTSDESVTGTGFKAEYNQACGATIEVPMSVTSNAITSPKFPGLITPHTICTWHLKAPEGSNIQLRFTHMNIQGSEPIQPTNVSCPLDYLQVLDGQTLTSPEKHRFCGTHIPRPVFSTSNYLTLHLHTGMPEGTGFRVLYSSVDTACGGTLFALSGEFASPLYPDSYPASYECIWTINAGQGNKIELNFESFNIEESNGCNLDYLQVHEINQEGRLLIHNCSDTIPPAITATAALWVKFNSDDQGTAPGFLANFAILSHNDLVGESGEIMSPMYPHLVTARAEYSWNIVVPYRKYISIEILDMNIELNALEDVCHSSIVIHDGPSDDSYIESTLCGHSSPSEPIITRGNLAYIKFNANFRHEGSAFRLRYTAIDSRPWNNIQKVEGPHSNCSYVVTVNTTTIIRSKNFPNNYDNNMNCQWTIETEKHSRLRLSLAFELEEGGYRCIFDKLELFDGIDGKPNWNKTATLCRRDQGLKVFYSSGSLYRIRFLTDSSVTAKGFSIIVRKVCGGILTEPDGIITSPNYPNNYPRSSCQWRIKSNLGTTIQITFDEFRISNTTQTCSDDSLLIYNGDSITSPYLGRGRFCGVNYVPSVPETSSNNALMIFSANNLNQDKGFHLTYHQVSAACGGHHQITEEITSITIHTPNYPHPPHPHTECIWIISGPTGKALTLNFIDTFDIVSDYGLCREAYVAVHDGGTLLSPKLGHFCGQVPPSTIQTTDSILYIHYFANAATVHSGFKAQIQSDVCGGTYRINSAGYLVSPNYPEPYGNNINCTWHVLGPFGHYMVFSFPEINIYNPSANCTSNAGKMSIIDTAGNNSVVICGEGITQPNFETAANNATVTFSNSMAGGTLNRFRVITVASTEVCGGTFTGSGGVIQSPGYPHGINHLRRCQWNLHGPPGSKISIKFDDIDLDFYHYMSNIIVCRSYIQIANGISSRAPFSHGFCANEIPPQTYNSSMNTMKVIFSSFRPSPKRGFKARWNSDYEQECGGSFTATAAPQFVTSPGFELGGYNHSLNCVWTINNPNPSTTSLNITLHHLNLEEGCYDYVVVEGVDVSGEVASMQKICHGEETLSYHTAYPTVKIVFISDYIINGTGFNISFGISNCGGYHTGPQNSFASPGYANGAYPVLTTCIWQFHYAEGSQIELEFTDFQLENSLDHDFVTIYNGFNIEAPTIQRYTGTTSPGLVGPSMSNALTVLFQSDGSVSARGFSAVARIHTRGCGGIYHGINGFISSPGFPENTTYAANSECIWDIFSPPGYQLNVSFLGSFDIETSEHCSNDFLQLSSKTFASGQMIWNENVKWCGKQMPPPYICNCTALRLKLRSNEAIEGKGFKFRYQGQCGGIYNAKEGSIMSPNHPNQYPNQMRCNYTIEASRNAFVILDFTAFDIEEGSDNGLCEYDQLIIKQKLRHWSSRSRYRTLYTLCGSQVPDPIVVRGPVLLDFASDVYLTKSGFFINYKIKDCGGNITTPGIIRLPTHPQNYMNRMRCIWDIMAPPDKVIYIKFQTLHLEFQRKCRYDHLSVYDGLVSSENKLLAKFCGDHSDDLPKLSTPNSKARLMFESDSIIHHSGFQAAIQFTYKCGGTVNISDPQATETIRSLDADNDGKYEPFLSCEWLVQGHLDKVISLNFTRMDIEGPGVNDTKPCPYDYVEIFDGPSSFSPSMGLFCGSSIPTHRIVSSSPVMFVRFHSDSLNQSAGFTARFGNTPSLCGPGSLTATPSLQSLESPNFPAHYPSGLRCRWVITAPENERVKIHMDDFSLESSPHCAKDALSFNEQLAEGEAPSRIFNSGTRVREQQLDVEGRTVTFRTELDLLRDYCGTIIPHNLTSESNRVGLQFMSDAEETASGFRLHYSISSCNTTYTADSGWIKSAHQGACYFSVVTTPGRYVTVVVSGYMGEDEANGFVKIYDGGDSSAPQLLSTTHAPTSLVRSTGNRLWFHVLYPPTRHFMLMYYYISDFSDGCGGNLHGMQTIAASPNFETGSPPSNRTCDYTFTVPSTYHAVVHFPEGYDVSGGGSCNDTFLEIYDVLPSNEVNLFTTVCEGDIPATHLSASNRLLLRFTTGTEAVTGTGWVAVVMASTLHD